MDEQTALRAVSEASFDYLFARANPEYAKLNGGLDAIREKMRQALSDLREFDDVDCRDLL